MEISLDSKCDYSRTYCENAKKKYNKCISRLEEMKFLVNEMIIYQIYSGNNPFYWKKKWILKLILQLQFFGKTNPMLLIVIKLIVIVHESNVLL